MASLTSRSLEQRIFLAAMVMLPLMQLSVGLQAGVVTFADVLFAAALTLWIVEWVGTAVASGNWKPRLRDFNLILLVYTVTALLSTVLAPDPRANLNKFAIDAYMAALAALTAHLLRGPMWKSVLRAWMLGAAIAAVAAISGAVLFIAGWRDPHTNRLLYGFGSLPPGPYSRISGTFLNVNMACNYLVASFMLLLGMTRMEWIGRRVARVLGLGLLIAAAMTVSLGLGGLALGLGIWFWAQNKDAGSTWRARAALALGIICAAAFLGAAALLVRADGMRHVGAVPVGWSQRSGCWEASARMFAEHPLAGAGSAAVPCPPWTNPSGEYEQLGDAHNLFLSVAAHKGTIGLAGLFVLILWLLKAGTVQGSAIGTAVLIAWLVAFLYHGLTGSFEHTRHVWILAGMVGAWDRERLTVPWSGISSRKRVDAVKCDRGTLDFADPKASNTEGYDFNDK